MLNYHKPYNFLFFYFLNSNIGTITAGINFKFSDAIILFSRSLGCIIFAFVIAWKLSIVFFAMLPLLAISFGSIVYMMKKYTVKEFEAYGSAGAVAQEVLSSIRTVFSLGLQNKKINKYVENLTKAEKLSIKKSIVIAICMGFSSILYNSAFAIAIYYGVHLTRTDCKHFKPSTIIQALFSITTAMYDLGKALPFVGNLSEGIVIKHFSSETAKLINSFNFS